MFPLPTFHATAFFASSPGNLVTKNSFHLCFFNEGGPYWPVHPVAGFPSLVRSAVMPLHSLKEKMVKSTLKLGFFRLFQHTELEHTPKKPLPTSYSWDSFHSWLCRGLFGVCDIGVCCNFLGLVHYNPWAVFGRRSLHTKWNDMFWPPINMAENRWVSLGWIIPNTFNW